MAVLFTVLFDVRGLTCDAAAVDALARLHLVTRRLGCELRLQNASGELRELVEFMGLGDVLVLER